MSRIVPVDPNSRVVRRVLQPTKPVTGDSMDLGVERSKVKARPLNAVTENQPFAGCGARGAYCGSRTIQAAQHVFTALS